MWKRCPWISGSPDGITKPYVNEDLMKFQYKCLSPLHYPQVNFADTCLVLHPAFHYVNWADQLGEVKKGSKVVDLHWRELRLVQLGKKKGRGESSREKIKESLEPLEKIT